MASILPLLLEDVAEGSSVDVTFSAVLDSATETLTSIEITEHRENVGITVNGARFSGTYRDSFDLGEGGLKYINNDATLGSCSHFEDLPDPSEARLYEFIAPQTLQTGYAYTVTLKYVYEAATGRTGGTTPSVPEDRELVQTFTQQVFGTWDKWAQQMRDYVEEGK